MYTVPAMSTFQHACLFPDVSLSFSYVLRSLLSASFPPDSPPVFHCSLFLPSFLLPTCSPFHLDFQQCSNLKNPGNFFRFFFFLHVRNCMFFCFFFIHYLLLIGLIFIMNHRNILKAIVNVLFFHKRFWARSIKIVCPCFQRALFLHTFPVLTLSHRVQNISK